MNDTEFTVTTKLELSEIITKCFYTLQEKGLYTDEELKRDAYSHNLKVKVFETIIATGLYYIMNGEEFKTDFNYLGNNNNIELLFDDLTLMKLLRGEKQ